MWFRSIRKLMNIVKEKNNNFVSRAEGKLAGAVRAFSFDFKNKIVMDIGSSTGGFTELALNLGAKKVFAIEKGTNQMKKPLRFDSRIDLREKTDVFDLKRQNFFEPIDVFLADVSFVSLKKILNHVGRNLVKKQAEFLVMLKPQFEAKDFQLNRGVVKNEKIRREIIKDFEFWLKENGFLILGKHDNELTGKNGNRERFYYLKKC